MAACAGVTTRDEYLDELRQRLRPDDVARPLATDELGRVLKCFPDGRRDQPRAASRSRTSRYPGLGHAEPLEVGLGLRLLAGHARFGDAGGEIRS
jgi:hypothetical protein